MYMRAFQWLYFYHPGVLEERLKASILFTSFCFDSVCCALFIICDLQDGTLNAATADDEYHFPFYSSR